MKNKYKINKIVDHLKDSRVLLDEIMYSDDNISDDEFNRLRSCYDVICLALDKLYNV